MTRPGNIPSCIRQDLGYGEGKFWAADAVEVAEDRDQSLRVALDCPAHMRPNKFRHVAPSLGALSQQEGDHGRKSTARAE